jgi:hypothetical protein
MLHVLKKHYKLRSVMIIHHLIDSVTNRGLIKIWVNVNYIVNFSLNDINSVFANITFIDLYLIKGIRYKKYNNYNL